MLYLALEFTEDNDFVLRGIDASALAMSAFYKLSLRRFVASAQGDVVVFKSGLTYLDMNRIIELCAKHAEKTGNALQISQVVLDYISHKELYIQKRARLGLEIKANEPQVQAHFSAYRKIVDAEMKRKLREKQMWDSFYMCTMKRSSNFSVPGSGKTASVLGVFAYLQAENLVDKIVVISPKNAFGSWHDEFIACFGEKKSLRMFTIHDKKYKTVAARKNALLLDSGKHNLILINYEGVHSYLETLCQLIDARTLLVFDEVHKVKKVGGARAQDAISIAQNAVYAIAMTGTPIPNTYVDIYNLLHILYPDEYEMFFNFSAPMLRDPSELEKEEINEKLLPFFCRTNKRQLSVPDANKDILVNIPATPNDNFLFSVLTKQYRRNKLALFLRVLQLESNPEALLSKLDLNDYRYILDDDADAIDEIDYVDYSDEIKSMIRGQGVSPKITACLSLTAKLTGEGKPVIIWCIFIDTIRQLEKQLKALNISVRCVFGEVSLEDRAAILDGFRAGNIQVLITNPHTLAESVSLHSVCHDAIYMEYSYNLVHLLQSKDRIHRLGLPPEQYTQYYFLQTVFETQDEPVSIDNNVYNRLMEKEQTMLNAIDKQILEVLPSSTEDLEMIFKGINLQRRD